MHTRHILLLPLATAAMLFAETIQTTDKFYHSTLQAISLIAMLLLLLHIIKSFSGKMRTSVMLRALVYYLISVGIVIIGQKYVGGIFTMIACIIFMGLFTKKVFQ